MIADRIAAAPISWGVCEVAGWGYQLPPSRVLSEMSEVGIRATELGPKGFLPDAPADKAAVLSSYGLAAVGGFVPAVLHDPARDPLAAVDQAIDGLVAAGAGVVVLAAATGQNGYDERPELDGRAWDRLLENLDRLVEHGRGRGVLVTLHPHVGTLVEREDEVRRVLDGSTASLCLDTGHLLVGGADPLALARELPHRIGHVHLKDVDLRVAGRVRDGELTYAEAVHAGMYRPLGRGDAGVADIVGALEGAGYAGWYVMEQDTVLDAAPEGDGPLADVRTSVSFLRGLAA